MFNDIKSMPMENKKEKNKKSIVYLIMRLSVIPVLLLGIVLTIYGQSSIKDGMTFEREKSLSGIARNVLSSYNFVDGGQFSFDENQGRIFKGETDLTSNYRIIDDIKDDTQNDIFISINDKIRLTTITDSKGNRIIGKDVPSEILNGIYVDKRGKYFENIQLAGKEYYGYAIPLRNDDNEIIGVVFAGGQMKEIASSMVYMVQGNIVICIFVLLLAGFLCYLGGNRIVYAIRKIKEYLHELARGNFEKKMDAAVLDRNDELAEIGDYAIKVGKSLDNMVSRDPLTNLLNRRACYLRVEDRKENDNYSIAIGDIDFFKKVNDTYGHDMGDKVLKRVATILKKEIGEEGFVSRWGGEEFLLINNGEKEDLYVKLENISSKIKDVEFEYPEGKFNVTVTFGVVTWVASESFEEAVKRADQKLYIGKENGRDQIVQGN